jgi:uncharacterized protein YozE (UPF0346 family)
METSLYDYLLNILHNEDDVNKLCEIIVDETKESLIADHSECNEDCKHKQAIIDEVLENYPALEENDVLYCICVTAMLMQMFPEMVFTDEEIQRANDNQTTEQLANSVSKEQEN